MSVSAEHMVVFDLVMAKSEFMHVSLRLHSAVMNHTLEEHDSYMLMEGL